MSSDSMGQVQIVLGDHITELPKSKLPASAATDNGQFQFICSSEELRYTDSFLQDSPAVVMGTGGVATVHMGRGRFAYSTDTWGFRSKTPELETEFLYRKIQQYLPIIDYAGFEGSGLKHLRKDFVKRLTFAIPKSPRVANKIVQVLATVDESIVSAEALLEKFQQIKAGLMHDLFARGIGPDGKLRPHRERAPELYQETPIGWIPKEWLLGGIEDYVIQPGGLKPGPFGSALTKADYVDSGYRVYGQEQVLAQSLAEGDYYVSKRKWIELNDFRVARGDLLMTLVGVGTIGKILIVKEPFEDGVINPRLMRIRPDERKCCGEFLANLIVSDLVRRQFNQYAGGGTMPVLNGSIVRKVRLPLVPIIEQEKIAQRIESAKLVLESESDKLDKLKRFRQGLMYDLLTGKVQVNPDLPDAAHV